MIRIGFHLSIAGSVTNSILEAKRNDYTAFQIFTTNPRTWRAPQINHNAAKQFSALAKRYDSIPYAHMPYLCNLATSNDDVYNKSMKMLLDNIRNCNDLGIGHLVMHLGSHLGKGIDYGIERTIFSLTRILDSTKRVNLLLENGAGYRGSVGSKFGEIGRIIDIIKSDRIGVCFDTCHAFAAGYDLRTDRDVDRLVDSIESAFAFSRIKLFHLNDARHGLGSGLDRHENIGKGNIGIQGFASLFKNRHFQNGSYIMETPASSIEDIRAGDINAVYSILESLGLKS